MRKIISHIFRRNLAQKITELFPKQPFVHAWPEKEEEVEKATIYLTNFSF